MFMTYVRYAMLGLCLVLATPARAELPAGISGAWYNPQQSGHGFTIEVLSDTRALMFWYVYDPAGNPVFLYIDGSIVGHAITGTAYAPRGMRFGQFNRADLQLPEWGTVRLDFSDCDHAVMRFDAIDPTYGAGAIALQRLTRILDSSCTLAAQPRAKTGLYRAATIAVARDPVEGEPEVHAAIDEQGRLYAMESLRYPNGRPAQNYLSLPFPRILGVPDASGRLQLELRPNGWLGAPRTASLSVDATGFGVSSAFLPVPEPGTLFWVTHLALQGEHTTRSLLPNLRAADVAGDYEFRAGPQFFPSEYLLSVEADGDLCQHERDRPCQRSGRLTAVAGNAGFFNFTLGTFSGRGWLELGPQGSREIVLVGVNDAILARKQ